MLPPIASRFVAGESAPVALDHARAMNDDGLNVILNLLGEHYHDVDDAAADTDAYVDLVGDLGRTDLDACISVKPSQIGLGVSDDAFRENLARIVNAADDAGVFTWIDMEDHPTTDVTLDAFEAHAVATDGNVGVCVQANLKRTRDDVERLAALPGKVRFVKGAYDEPKAIAYTDKADVNEAYEDLLAYAFEHFDDGIAVGSHDPAMIAHARELHEEYGTPYEVQMLMGVRTDAQHDLAAEGVEVWQYAPYGNKWLSYFYRRVRERRENLWFAVRSVLGV
jgi:proline dehydrogenase